MNQQFLRFIFFLLVCLTLPLSATAQVVEIPDPNLRAAIQTALGKPSGHPITANEMVTLTRLDAWESDISDLTGLEGATNLTWLRLVDNSISDISALGGLTNLTYLNLWGNSVSDISALAGLTQLGSLSLVDSSISDISALGGLTNLTSLNLWGNSVSDISALGGLTNLIYLSLGYNPVSDISALGGLTNLTYLRLGGNFISDISALGGLTQLTSLDLWDNFISDISALGGLTQLTSLDLWSNFISDISALGGLTQLTSLDLRGNSISDISALGGLTQLTSLDLRGNSISDISALGGLTNLTYLDLWDNFISDISALAGLTQLTELNLRDNFISDISPLVANMGLGSGDELNLRGNRLSALSFTHISTLQSREVTVDAPAGVWSVGEPYTVRLIYFLPSGREPRPNIDADMDALIKVVQEDYARDMERHGFGRKTFRFETDTTGKAVVHHVNGQFTAAYYEHGTFGKVTNELPEQFDLSKNIYLIVVDSGYLIDGSPGLAGGRTAIINSIEKDLSSYRYLVSHELRHTFGLLHDFRVDARGFTPEISKCTAEFLDVHRYFNAPLQSPNLLRNTTTQMFPPSLVSPPNTIRLRFEVADPDGLHQARLHTPEVKVGGGFLACKRTGTRSTVEFITTALLPKTKFVSLQMIDVHGNISWGVSYPIDMTSLLPPPEVVLIPDANLAAAVREAIGLAQGDAITSHTMLELVILAMGNHPITWGHPITDLTGLEHAVRLSVLDLSVKSVSDISGLGGLTQLTSLRLRGNSISDISGLGGLTQLTSLDLWGNFISDISALGGLTQLTYLNLRDNSVSDISALGDLTNLTHLDLRDNSVSDISALAGLTNLTHLDLRDNSVSDISALGGLTQLTYLNLRDNSVSDISALAGLTNLTYLNLRDNSVSDISALAGLTNLTTLDLWNNSVSDISALRGLTNLTTLDLWNNSVSDISALAGLTQLAVLVLAGNPVSDISALAGLTQLAVLVLTGNSVSDISPLVANRGLGSGDTVYVMRNPLSYASIHTHIPTLQSRGVEVGFDNQAHPALLKISSDNQNGASFAPLSRPFIVEAQDESGSALAGISVTFAVTAGGGTLSTIITRTDENGRAQSTLTLGPNLGTNTVKVSAAGIESTVIFHAIADKIPTEYLWSVPEGISLIHLPLKVAAVDGIEKPIQSVSGLYDALGGADTVNLLATDLTTQGWRSYISVQDRGTPADTTLTDDTGIIAVMNGAVSLRLNGDALGTNGNSTITLHPGPNLVGVPLRDSRIARVSDLFRLDGIRDNVLAITVADNGRLQTVRQAGEVGDIPVIGGQSFVLMAQEAATVAISGGGWYNAASRAATAPSVGNAALHPLLTSIQVTDSTPVLALRGSLVPPAGGWGKSERISDESRAGPRPGMPHLQSGSGFRVTVKNLSTDRKVATVTAPDETDYRLTVVDLDTGRAARIGDILEIAVRSPSPLIGVQPLRYTVTVEDVKRSRIELPALVAYEIPSETELLANYPNPFNPETWIPYRLAEDGFVTLTIYDTAGQVVRTLDVGHRIAAVYERRSKAIHWDGKNDLGEGVASGIYFYTLSAGDYSATRKMVILK